MHTVNEAKIKKTLKAAINAGSRILLKSYKKNDFKVELKSAKEWVTGTDVAVEKIIITEILKFYPESNFLAEESGTNIKNKENITWIIDPIDGTNNFITRYPYFCISIAGYLNDNIISGAIFNPLTSEFFFAIRNKGAYLNEKGIYVNSESKLSNSIFGTGFVMSAPGSVTKNLKNLKNVISNTKSFRRTGSAALDLAYTSCGRQQGYWQLLARPWDYAAGVLLVEEAGGKVTDIQGKKITLNSKALLATNKKKQAKMLKNLNEELLYIYLRNLSFSSFVISGVMLWIGFDSIEPVLVTLLEILGK